MQGSSRTAVPLTIISGGQTGADRAALDAAIALGLPYGGWCPKGGWAEDMLEPPGLLAIYPELRETLHRDPRQRTEWNIRDSDCVLVLTAAGQHDASSGTLFALGCAERLKKPLLIVEIASGAALLEASTWIEAQTILRLSIGGPRESEVPGIYTKARTFLLDLLRHYAGNADAR
jgi:hypothetical protein